MTTTHESPTAEDVRYLTELLASDRCADDALNVHQLRGFLWAVMSSPAALMTQDWLPVVLGEVKEGEEPFETQEDLERFLAVMLKFYQDAQHQLITKSILFSEEYIYSEDPELIKPLSQWCEGLLIGHDWLEDIWAEASVDIDLDDDSSLQDTLDSILAIITLFSDIPQGLAEADDPESLKAKLAFAADQVLSTALLEYAQVGLELRRLADELARLYARTGRNDPCPCGSGQKFKRCCMP
ncbi:MAG: UPF0149 family protein [Agitococcus sp.]|nr:UPF0149 family protein [Agitococcus sp.]